MEHKTYINAHAVTTSLRLLQYLYWMCEYNFCASIILPSQPSPDHAQRCSALHIMWSIDCVYVAFLLCWYSPLLILRISIVNKIYFESFYLLLTLLLQSLLYMVFWLSFQINLYFYLQYGFVVNCYKLLLSLNRVHPTKNGLIKLFLT